ncbi:tRNA uridine-5-carboxymethylaminomethyl(34) synthesis GTPase MnmE [Leptolyngbya sp. FACHB-711]|uniref:tRNA uridine-5-carboxymethylaminomethyl(34) synthesis GTPase MnmE n=1 Tax=unclassified Leptolyngbya TaxID=2650499 RepID=UPI00168924BC|nr:tRNA uridine-5-carboxymethylaminomethyl(34) synthesis GTPase MnmE [Leptolyngbya sp. FACHB-711]MBD1850381.1 tRNA uridine-5-carboxymethylaminomethyl(34) synthesis GTPase MnmE [Cyanobacteria bacterium FACHB-502]MBD2024638.1 tRNA uridine-5-carboxymethylaminomethyl(34) synthesis GTPase MnmE [Leptolyngbya sp. FACHB-711]
MGHPAPAKIYQGETIAAIATAVVPQQGSVSIVRLSGRGALAIARSLFDAPGNQTWESHRILYGQVRHPQTRQGIDEALLMLMLSPRSYTREDVVEFHCHGGMMAVQQVLQLCLEQGARLAQPGEFTLRAFLNGRIDLTQAESISDLVGAQSTQAAQTALAGLQGKLAQPIRHLRSIGLEILAEVEARIDFEDDLPPLDEDWIRVQIDEVRRSVQQILATADRGELLRTGVKVAIVGRPNVGKSSLLNAWSRTDRAIVTDLPGTTRDVVESYLVVQGIPVQVLDTAGIREAADRVEQIGVERSHQAAQTADLVLLTVDAEAGWTAEDLEIYQQVKHRPLILVLNKIDLIDTLPDLPAGHPIVKTAAAQQKGIEDLEKAIVAIIHADQLQAANLDFAINQRQAAALTRAQSALAQVQETIAAQLPLDFWTIDLRSAIQALGEITGEEVTEAVLDQIFSKFCIGK